MRLDAAEFHAAILAGLRILHEPGDVVEVRIVHTPRGTVSGYFNDPEALARAVVPWDGKASIFVMLNPVVPALLARAVNRLVERSRFATKDDEILERRWLLVDLDPVRPAGISATDAEVAAARAQAEEIARFLAEADWPGPAFAMSGNGYHLLYRISLANTPASTDLVRRVLKALAARFSDGAVKVDESVFNAARLVKLYGTVAVKGDPVPDRPHRRARIDVDA